MGASQASSVNWGVNQLFCQQCGEQNGPEAKFCFSCGAKLAPLQGQSETVAAQHQPPPRTNSEMHLAYTPAGEDEPGETPVATKQSTQGISSNSTRKGIVTFAGIVWFIVALVDFFLCGLFLALFTFLVLRGAFLGMSGNRVLKIKA